MEKTVQKYLLVIFATVCLFLPARSVYAFHPFYVSVTEMSLNAKTKSLEISCKMFAEDVEDVLKQNYKTPVDLGDNKSQALNNKLIKDYILKHLSINIASAPATLNFIGYEKERESVYCYFEIPNAGDIKKITINNNILQDYKQEQINIMHVIVNGNRKSTKLDYPASQASFSF